MYYVLSALGIMLGIFCTIFLGKINCRRFSLIAFLVICLLSFFAISRLLGLFSYGAYLYNRGSFSFLKACRGSGFIIWGAIIGFCLAARLLAKKFALSISDSSMLSALFLTSFHWLAKLGCFHAGCCYGIISNSSLAILPIVDIGPSVARLPVQLIESSVVFLLWCTVICFSFRNRLRRHALPLYLFSYSVTRFFLEFFRGDDTRGKVGGFYFSQWISIFILSLVVTIYAIGFIKKNLNRFSVRSKI